MDIIFILIRITGLVLFGFDQAYQYNLDYLPPFVAAFIVIVAYWLYDVEEVDGETMLIIKPGQTIVGVMGMSRRELMVPAENGLIERSMERVYAIIGISPEEFAEEIRFHGTLYGRQQAVFNDLDRQRKILIATLKEKHRGLIWERNKGKTGTDREKDTDGRLDDLARCDPEYKAFSNQMKDEEIKLSEIGEEYFKRRNIKDLLTDILKTARAEMHYLQTANNL